jgi:hypothetical protein
MQTLNPLQEIVIGEYQSVFKNILTKSQLPSSVEKFFSAFMYVFLQKGKNKTSKYQIHEKEENFPIL